MLKLAKLLTMVLFLKTIGRGFFLGLPTPAIAPQPSVFASSVMAMTRLSWKTASLALSSA